MKLNIQFTEEINAQKYDYQILCISTKAIAKIENLVIKKAIEASEFTAKMGKTLTIHSEKIILVGAGDKITKTEDTNKIGGTIAKILSENKQIKNCLIVADNLSFKTLAQIAFAIKLRAYTFAKYKTDDKSKTASSRKISITIHARDASEATTEYASFNAIADGIYTTRDLANEPSNTLTTTEFVTRIKTLSKLGCSIEIFDEKALRKMGANLILAVGAGSVNPPYMAIIKYTGNKKSKQSACLVGKGLCFDAGGICIKPSKGMDEMKSDMTGAATVVGVIESIAKQHAPINVVGVIGLAENMPDGASYKPGDILTSLSGQTVEVIDTDAEGRLVLADCLTYASTKLKPNVIIDLATLTGAIIVALGDTTTGLFTPSDNLATNLTLAGKNTAEDLWRMPLGEKFTEMIKSDIADIRNLGNPSRSGGSITAAAFLEKFVMNKDIEWAHLDIAGSAWANTATDIAPKGMTGACVYMLNHYLTQIFAKK